jgi:anti-sigma factor RsiW
VRCPPPSQLSALTDGELGARRVAKLREHLLACATCARGLAELEALKQALAGEAVHPPEPEATDGVAWMKLQARLAAEPESPRRLGWLLAPASLSLAALALVFGLRHRVAASSPSDDELIAEAETEFRGAEARYAGALEKLRAVTVRLRTDWPADRRADYDRAQVRLDAAIAECQRVVRERPADADAEQLMFAAYRKEIDFLQDQLLVRGQP